MGKHWLLEFAICACKILDRTLLFQSDENMFISKLRKTRVISPNAVKNKRQLLPSFPYKYIKISFEICKIM